MAKKYVIFSTLQMKEIFCNELAACLYMKPPPAPLLEVKTGDHRDKEQICEADKEAEMKKDWILAAAVLDRICAIAFAVIFIVGTLIFVILFITRP